MLATAAVFHLERSALNANADWNAVKVLSMPWRSQSKNKSGRRTKIKEMGEKTEVDERHKEWKSKELEWTYCMTCTSPPPCPTWKGPR